MAPRRGPKSKVKKKRDIRQEMKTKSSRQFFKYTAENLQRALADVCAGLKNTFQASLCYSIPRSTLRDKLKKRSSSYGVTGRECILGRHVENELKEWLLQLCRSGSPIPKKGLLFSVQHLCRVKEIRNPFTNDLPGDKWFHKFLSRHSELSLKRSEYLSKARGKVTEEYIRRWFKETKELLGDDFIVLLEGERNRIYNMDETAFYINPDGELVIAESGKPAPKVGNCNETNQNNEDDELKSCAQNSSTFNNSTLIPDEGAINVLEDMWEAEFGSMNVSRPTSPEPSFVVEEIALAENSINLLSNGLSTGNFVIEEVGLNDGGSDDGVNSSNYVIPKNSTSVEDKSLDSFPKKPEIDANRNQSILKQSQITPHSARSIFNTKDVTSVSVTRRPRRSLTPGPETSSTVNSGTSSRPTVNPIRIRSSSEPPSPIKTASRSHVQKILNDYHLFPSKTTSSQATTKRKHFPSVITHDLWVAMKEADQEEKESKEKEKLMREKKRQEAQITKAEKEILKKKKQDAAKEKKEKNERLKKQKAEKVTPVDNRPRPIEEELEFDQPMKIDENVTATTSAHDEFLLRTSDSEKSSQPSPKKRGRRFTRTKQSTGPTNTIKKQPTGPTSTMKKKPSTAPTKNRKAKKSVNNGKKDNDNPACPVCLEFFLSGPGVKWILCSKCSSWCHEECSTDAVCEECL